MLVADIPEQFWIALAAQLPTFFTAVCGLLLALALYIRNRANAIALTKKIDENTVLTQDAKDEAVKANVQAQNAVNVSSERIEKLANGLKDETVAAVKKGFEDLKAGHLPGR